MRTCEKESSWSLSSESCAMLKELWWHSHDVKQILEGRAVCFCDANTVPVAEKQQRRNSMNDNRNMFQSYCIVGIDSLLSCYIFRIYCFAGNNKTISAALMQFLLKPESPGRKICALQPSARRKFLQLQHRSKKTARRCATRLRL